jgi:hypothetical protein
MLIASPIGEPKMKSLATSLLVFIATTAPVLADGALDSLKSGALTGLSGGGVIYDVIGQRGVFGGTGVLIGLAHVENLKLTQNTLRGKQLSYH